MSSVPQVTQQSQIQGQELTLHQQILLMSLCGETVEEISKVVDVAVDELRVIVSSELFQKQFKNIEQKVARQLERRADITKRASFLQHDALDVIQEIMLDGNSSASLRRQCARDILRLVPKKEKSGSTDIAKFISDCYSAAQQAYEAKAKGEEVTVSLDVGKLSETIETEPVIEDDHLPPFSVVEKTPVKGNLNEKLTELLRQHGKL